MGSCWLQVWEVVHAGVVARNVWLGSWLSPFGTMETTKHATTKAETF